MPLEQKPGEDDIITALRAIPGVDVIEDEYTEDSYVPKIDTDTGLFLPYITVKFDVATATFDNGIADPSWDTQRAGVQVFVVSPLASVTRNIRDQVRVALLKDFRPTDGSYLKSRGGYSFVDADLGYHRYVQVLGFSYTFNLSPTTA